MSISGLGCLRNFVYSKFCIFRMFFPISYTIRKCQQFREINRNFTLTGVRIDSVQINQFSNAKIMIEMYWHRKSASEELHGFESRYLFKKHCKEWPTKRLVAVSIPHTTKVHQCLHMYILEFSIFLLPPSLPTPQHFYSTYISNTVTPVYTPLQRTNS